MLEPPFFSCYTALMTERNKQQFVLRGDDWYRVLSDGVEVKETDFGSSWMDTPHTLNIMGFFDGERWHIEPFTPTPDAIDELFGSL